MRNFFVVFLFVLASMGQASILDALDPNKVLVVYGFEASEENTSILETKKKNLAPFFGEKDRTWHIHGLGLSNEVLNYIYYWNAARLVPNVRRSLLNQGYQV